MPARALLQNVQKQFTFIPGYSLEANEHLVTKYHHISTHPSMTNIDYSFKGVCQAFSESLIISSFISSRAEIYTSLCFEYLGGHAENSLN